MEETGQFLYLFVQPWLLEEFLKFLFSWSLTVSYGGIHTNEAVGIEVHRTVYLLHSRLGVGISPTL